MICKTCAQAADNLLASEYHCDAAGGPDAACDCQHRTDRYRKCTCTGTEAGLELCARCPAPPKGA